MKHTIAISAILLGGCATDDGAIGGGPGGKSDDGTTSDFRFDFDFRSGADHGFTAIFRDVHIEKHAEYLRRKLAGLDLGPIAPLEQPPIEIPAETTHWLMHDGLYPLPDGLEGHGFLVQGNNHSDDMDMYIVRQLGSADGLRARTKYRVTFHALELAGNAPVGASGLGGSPALRLGGMITTTDPTKFVTDEISVRHPEGVFALPAIELGGNGVCAVSGTAMPPCPSGRIPFMLNRFTKTEQNTLTVTTNRDGRFWLMVGGHSGFEGFSAIYYTRVLLTLEVID